MKPKTGLGPYESPSPKAASPLVASEVFPPTAALASSIKKNDLADEGTEIELVNLKLKESLVFEDEMKLERRPKATPGIP